MAADDQLLSPSATLPHNLLDALNNGDDDLMDPPPGLAEPAGLDGPGLAGEWSWKTSAKDFVPGTFGDVGTALSSSGSTFGGSHSHSGLTRSPVVGPSTSASSAAGSPALGPVAWTGTGKTGWTGMNPDGLMPMAVETDVLGSPIAMDGLDPAEALAMEACQGEEDDAAQFYVQQQLWCLQQVKDQMEVEWQKERKAMIDQIARFRAVLTRYSIPLEEVDDKMEQLLKEMPPEEDTPPTFMTAKDVWETQAWKGSGNPRRGSGASGSSDMPLDEPLRRPPGLEEIEEGDVASTLKAMFPHAKVRTGSEGTSEQTGNEDEGADSLSDPEVKSRLEVLQTSTSSELDDRALKSLGSLEAAKALEVLQKVEELVEAQGGECRNLSSMLQSVCRKMERKMLSETKAGVNPGDEQGTSVRPKAEESKEYWTVKRVEKAAERAFETWYEGDRWRLKFSMTGLRRQALAGTGKVLRATKPIPSSAILGRMRTAPRFFVNAGPRLASLSPMAPPQSHNLDSIDVSSGEENDGEKLPGLSGATYDTGYAHKHDRETSVPMAQELFWLKRQARRTVLKRLAEEAAEFGPALRRKAAELRASAARRRLELLRAGQVEQYEALLSETKDKRMQEVLEETNRIMAEIGPLSPRLDEKVGQPRSLQHGQLMPHQLAGLRWLARLVDHRLSGILADDMGLGKTVQTLALLAFLAESRNQPGTHLVIAPLSTLQNWVDEIMQWVPSFRYLVYRGSEKSLSAVEKAVISPDRHHAINLVITTYETVANRFAFLGHHPWHCVVVDEGHRIKNFHARSSQAVRRLPCQHRLLLTGTPIQNSLRELWSLLSFVAPSAFNSLENFEQWFALPAPPSVRLGAQEEAEVRQLLSEEEELLIIQRLHKVLRPFLLRRTKEQVLTDLPPKTEAVIWVPLSSWQKVLYRKGLRTIQRVAGQAKLSSGGVSANAMSGMALRKAVNHPFHYLSKKAASGQPVQELIRASGKFEFLDRFLPRLVKLGHKILIFAQMRTSLDLLQRLLDHLGLGFSRIDGSTVAKKRAAAISSFRSDGSISVMLLTTKAGGLGLNLQPADTVILFDSDWNPQSDLQACDRAHRIGQTRPVLAVRLMTPTAMDRGLLERSSKKLDMEKKVIRAGHFSDTTTEMSKSLLLQLVKEARQSRGEGGSRAHNLMEMNRLMARSDQEMESFTQSDLELLGVTDDASTTEEILEQAGRLIRIDDVSKRACRKHRLSVRAVVESLQSTSPKRRRLSKQSS
ncbi:SNF2 [Symbiodinium natans]|uniref:SNF2 protein n=1 Tax=Symbiodinium natans TaxID=878477 RepID=A0A812SHP4_9DINO|nr:SNF2 [Symbiodinium natans]